MKRVKQISLDILVDDETDGCDLAEAISYCLAENGYNVLGAAFQEDMTEVYKNEYGHNMQADNGVVEYYVLAISVLDEHGNRIDAHEITGGNDKDEIIANRTRLQVEISNGKYDHLNRHNCTLSADIEVHDDYTWKLLEII